MTTDPNALPDLSRPLTEAEIDELDRALAALPEDRDSFDIAMLEGYLVGVLLQPESIPDDDWLPPIFDAPDGEPVIPGDEAQVARVLELLMRHFATLEAQIEAREPFDPILYDIAIEGQARPSRDQALAALWPWASGFAAAMHEFPEVLEIADDDEAVDDAIAEIFRHVPVDPDDDSEHARELREDRARLDEMSPLADLDDAVAAVVDAVMDIADVTRPREPLVRDGPKVGRNDPCPCGSGRKYKQCHGRSDD